MKDIFYPAGGPMPYESIYSIYLKVSHANFLSLNAAVGKTQDIISDHQWAQHKLTKKLKRKFNGLEDHLPWSYVPAAALGRATDELRFCQDCIKFGYHSVFNSVSFHQVCILHKCALKVACRSCTKNFFRGFRDSITIPNIMDLCENCGFFNIGFYTELSMRRGKELMGALRSTGEAQARWYKAIQELDGSGCGYCDMYYTNSISRAELTGPFEKILHLQSPEVIARTRCDDQPIALVGRYRVRGRAGGHGRLGEFSAKDKLRLHSNQEIFAKIEQRYFAHHRACLAELNEITAYPDGAARSTVFCPMALAYVLMRMKYRYEVWPTPGSVSVLRLDSSNNPLPTFAPCWNYREAALVFLSILGRLQFHVAQGDNFILLSRPEIEYFGGRSWPVIFRRISYPFRVLCRGQMPTIKVERSGFGGPILVRCQATVTDLVRRSTKEVVV
jgi:hypothetical protein